MKPLWKPPKLLLDRLLQLALDPNFTLSRFRTNVPSDDPTYLAKRERLYEGMRLAGVPEG